MEMKRFKGKRYLVTGGTSGIGFATAKRIYSEDGEAAVTGVTQEHLDEAGSQLPSAALVMKNDSSKISDIEELASTVENQMGKLDGVFLNAGFGKFAPVEEITEGHFDSMFDVNVKGLALQMAKLKPLIKEGGSIVITSSVVPYLGQAQGAVYAGTKGAVSAMMRSFATDMADKNIRVNAVCPGPIETNFFSGTGMSEEEQKEMTEQIQNQIPLGRFGKSEEVASLVCYLLSDEASYITGSEFMIDGGMTLR